MITLAGRLRIDLIDLLIETRADAFRPRPEGGGRGHVELDHEGQRQALSNHISR
jgi:hypothetical protein